MLLREPLKPALPALAQEIVDKHLCQQTHLEKNILPLDTPFFTRQKKVVLANSGLIDKESLEAYVARGGYTALGKALREMTPQEVCDEISNSGLRGRGGRFCCLG